MNSLLLQRYDHTVLRKFDIVTCRDTPDSLAFGVAPRGHLAAIESEQGLAGGHVRTLFYEHVEAVTVHVDGVHTHMDKYFCSIVCRNRYLLPNLPRSG